MDLRQRCSIFFACAAFVCAGLAGPAAARDLYKGWWVVVAAYPTEPWQRQAADLARVEATAKRCHAETFNDFSAKFKGFAPGYNVFVIGAFAARGEAEARLKSVRPCFPGAYLKQGEHLGE